MLILTRRINENIIIRDDITISVLNVVDGVATIGIDAPSDINIRRAELPKLNKEDQRHG